MEIKLNDDQQEMLRQARRFCENELPMKHVREMFEGAHECTGELWGKVVGMGWTALFVPEQYGGLGMGMLDLALVLQELGRAVAPVPLFATVLLGAGAVMEAGSDAQKRRYLAGVADGSLRGTLALSEPDSGADPAYIALAARRDGNGYVLNGVKIGVPDAGTAHFLVVAARAPEGITLFVVDLPAPGVSITPLPTMDGTRKLSAVEFRDARLGPESVLGEPGQGWEPLARTLGKAAVGLAAECVGGGERAMEIAAEYARVRVQFDQPIGSFQAVKHRCAQMYVDTESSRSIMYWAAWAQDQPDEAQAALAASAAKVHCAEAYKTTAASAVQVLGGTGFSWEHDIHFYLKRAKGNEAALGDGVYHRNRVVTLTAGV
jgi:alkylation response protein AidB-like acyl-CoA dehydrogenase